MDEIAGVSGVSNEVTHLIYSHHHADHAGASSLFGRDITRIGHNETQSLLLCDDDPAMPPPDETFQDRRSLEIGGERIELAWYGPNHSPDNIFIYLPDHDALMLVQRALRSTSCNRFGSTWATARRFTPELHLVRC